MVRSKLKNCNDILDYLSFLERKVTALGEELNSLKFSIFSKEARDRKKEIKANLKKIYEILDYYDDFLYDATTFQREDLDVFFVKYFTALYGIKYTVEENAKDISEGSQWVPTDIIASERDFARIDKKFNFKRKVNVDDILYMCQDSCLCIGGPEEYTLLEGTKLSKDLEGFPELAETVKILVDLKLSDPELSDKKRLAIGLKIAITRLNKKVPTSSKEQLTTPYIPKVTKEPQVGELSSDKALVQKPISPVTSEPFKMTYASSSNTTPRKPSSSTLESEQVPPKKEEKVLTKSLMGKYLHH